MPGAPDDQSNKRGVRVRSAALGPHLPHTRPHVGRRTCPGQLLLRLARFPHRPNIGPKKEQPGIIGSRSSSDVLHYVESWTGQAMSYMLTRARNAHGKTVGDVEGKEYPRKVGESKKYTIRDIKYDVARGYLSRSVKRKSKSDSEDPGCGKSPSEAPQPGFATGLVAKRRRL